jgi:aspartate kinase
VNEDVNKIVKFGGSCLATPGDIRKAADKVAREVRSGRRVIVVVSALSGVTDQLLTLAKEATSGRVTAEALDDIASMGERTSMRIMASSLRALGLTTWGVDPHSSLWPIFTDTNFGNARIDLEKTRRAVHDNILPLLREGAVVVIPGFIGLSPDGKVTTLGRGGSDITAMVLGDCSNAEEVVFVKDVAGILSADPKKVKEPLKIDALDAEEAYSLANAGAKVVHPQALLYKSAKTVLRVVGFDEPSLSGGTVVIGRLEADLIVDLHPAPLAMLTLVTQNRTLRNIARLLSSLASTEGDLLGLTVSSTAILLYVENSDEMVKRLHDTIKKEQIAKAIHHHASLAMIVVSGYALESIPGIIDTVVSPLAERTINLFGAFTISSSIRLFVPWEDREIALSSVKYVLREFTDGSRGRSE